MLHGEFGAGWGKSTLVMAFAFWRLESDTPDMNALAHRAQAHRMAATAEPIQSNQASTQGSDRFT